MCFVSLVDVRCNVFHYFDCVRCLLTSYAAQPQTDWNGKISSMTKIKEIIICFFLSQNQEIGTNIKCGKKTLWPKWLTEQKIIDAKWIVRTSTLFRMFIGRSMKLVASSETKTKKNRFRRHFWCLWRSENQVRKKSSSRRPLEIHETETRIRREKQFVIAIEINCVDPIRQRFANHKNENKNHSSKYLFFDS